MQPPPCLVPGQPLNACARGVYAFEINSTIDLTGPWHGWKLRGSVLVSPDKDRITPERLRGLLFVESLTKPKRSPVDGAKKNLSVPVGRAHTLHPGLKVVE